MIFNDLFLFIEANIAAGKTELCDLIDRMKSDIIEVLKRRSIVNMLTGRDIQVIKEPVDEWIEEFCAEVEEELEEVDPKTGEKRHIKKIVKKNILQMFYDDPKRYALMFQHLVFSTRIRKIERMRKPGLNIIERSVFSDREVFAQTCVTHPVEKKAYDHLYEFMLDTTGLPCDGFIYLRCDPETCFRRGQKRGREEEKSGVTLEYLTRLHQKHEAWLMNPELKDKVFVIDVSEDMNQEQYEVYMLRKFFEAINFFVEKNRIISSVKRFREENKIDNEIVPSTKLTRKSSTTFVSVKTKIHSISTECLSPSISSRTVSISTKDGDSELEDGDVTFNIDEKGNLTVETNLYADDEDDKIDFEDDIELSSEIDTGLVVGTN